MIGVVLPVLFALLVQSADRGQQSRPAPSAEQSGSTPAVAVPSTPGDKAFGRLFTLQALPRNPDGGPLIVEVPDQKPAAKIVCGMVVIQADPNVDPKFVIHAPVDTSAYKIRRIQPRACAD